MNYRRLCRAALVLLPFATLVALCGPVQAAGPATDRCVTLGPNPMCFHSIQEAINASSAGDNIYIIGGTYHEHLIIKDRVSLYGAGWTDTIVDGDNVPGMPVMYIGPGISSGTIISGLQVTRGANNTGGCIVISNASPVIRDTWVNKCHADAGGGVWVGGGSPEFYNVPAWENHATQHGGGFFIAGGAHVVMDGLTSQGTNGTLLANEAGINGGAIYVKEAEVDLRRLRMAVNRAGVAGGAVNIQNPSGPVTLTLSIIGYQLVLGVPFGGNEATNGGGLNLEGASQANIQSNYFEHDAADQYGGALRIDASSGQIRGNFLISNTSGTAGGGMRVSGTLPEAGAPRLLTVAGNWLERNASLTGGGLAVDGNATTIIDGNGVFSNTAQASGGGLYLLASPAVTLTNNLVTGNRSNPADPIGAGVMAYESTMRLVNNTIADNLGDGVWFRLAEGARIVNNIITNNHYGTKGSGIAQSQVVPTTDYQILYNDVWGNTGAGNYTNVISGAGNLSVDPQVVAEGGLFKFFHIRPTSPVRATGSLAWAPGYDVDGQPRGVLGWTAMGADEVLYQAYLPVSMRQ